MATFAGRYDEALLKAVAGRLSRATSAIVAVYETDGETLATLYTDRTKATQGDNPLTPDADSNLEFFADPGQYVLSISEDGTVVRVDTVTVMADPAESGLEAAAAQAAAIAAAATDATTKADAAEAAAVAAAATDATFKAAAAQTAAEATAATYTDAEITTLSGTTVQLFNPRAEGATGLGITDDTTAIQAALDKAGDAGGGEVPVPPGTFLFTQLAIPANVTLRGYGGTLRLVDAHATDAGANYYPIHNMDGAGGWNDGAKLRDLIINGNGANNADFTVADAVTIGGENVEVIDCTITDPPDSGIMFSGGQNARISGNRIDGGRDVGIYVNDGSAGTVHHENIISENRITGAPAGGIALKRVTQRTIVTENTVYNCGNGITLENGSTTTDYSTNVEITNNRLRYIGYIWAGAAKTGIVLRGSANVICSGNRIEDVEGVGIKAEGCSDSTIEGNVISYEATALTTVDGIVVRDRGDGAYASLGVSVIGNVVADAPRHGIFLDNIAGIACDNEIVALNIVRSTTGAALRIAANHGDVSVVGNVLDGDSFDAEIYIGASVHAAGNTLVNGTYSGAWGDVRWDGADQTLRMGPAGDVYFGRVAADIISGPQYRGRSSLIANYGSAFQVAIGSNGSGPALSLSSLATLYAVGAGQFRSNADLRFDNNDDGPILKDRTSGAFYRLLVNGGALSVEAI